MRRLALLGCWLALGMAGQATAAEVTPKDLTPAQKEQAKLWMRQLGDRSWKVREKAAQQLMHLGSAAVQLLKEGTKNKDAEVRRRCVFLLERATRTETEIALEEFLANKDSTRLLKLPTWARFSKAVGSDDVSKRLFVEMFCHEGAMLAELDKNTRDFTTRFQAHLQQIQRNLYTPFGIANPISHARVVALLFIASDPRLGDNIQNFYALNNLFYQQTVQQGFRDNAGSRKLLVAFLESRTNPSTVSQAFYIANQLQLKEALPLAMKMLKAKETPSYARGTAVLFVGKLGSREHVKELQPLLTDTTSLGAVRTGTTTIRAEMRDVALAAMIQLSGQDIHSYPFPYLQQFRGSIGNNTLPAYYFGFADEAGRTAAFKRWKDSQAPKKK